MGSLHDGHLSLLRRSIEENDVTCASIFVNPLQFNSARDYQIYPRELESDYEILRQAGCDMVFGGNMSNMFERSEFTGEIKMLRPGPYAKGLEGEFRPGHLQGVCTVVDRLFRIVGKCRAYFGEKDYQQLLVVRDLAERIGYPQVVGCKCVRDPDGLALSSRNSLLSRRQHKTALCISRALSAVKDTWERGERDASVLQSVMLAKLDKPGVKVDYAELRDPESWLDAPCEHLERAVALIAAYVGDVRLIDNLRLDAD